MSTSSSSIVLRLAGGAFALVGLAAAALEAGAPNFDYERGRAVDVKPSDVTLREVTYLGAAGQRTKALVVSPSTPGRHPAVLFVHWYGEPFQTSNRTQFFPDALRLASHGVVSLLVDSAWSDPKWFGERKPADDFTTSVGLVKEGRRALDVLLSLDTVDPQRIAYVGHDFGAMYGTLAVAADRRPRAFVFIAGTSAFSDWFLLGRKLDAAAERAVREELAPLDPLRYIGSLGTTALLLQFAKKDEYVTEEAARALIAAAQEPKSARFYECGHEMNGRAMEERTTWLLEVLGLAGPK
jgi:dienelactone hydrolase